MPPRPALNRLPSRLLSLAREQHGLLTTVQLGREGLGRNQIRSLRRAGVLAPAINGVWSATRPDRLTDIRAAMLAVGGGVGCFSSAATVLRLPTPFAPAGRPQVSLDPATRRHQLRGVELHWLTLGPEDVIEVDGIPVTAPARLFRDAARTWSRDDAVALLDAAYRARLLTPSDLAASGKPLTAKARVWASLADGRSESPLETRVRLLLHDARLETDVVPQHELRSPAGRFIARLDLAVPALRVGVECDGRDIHELPAALFRDRHRDDDVRSAGWRLVRVTGDDVRNQPADVVRRIRRALAQAG